MPDSSQGSPAQIRVTLALLAVRNSTIEIATSGIEAIALPSCSPRTGGSLDHVARGMLSGTTGSDHGYLEQLYTFGFDTGSSSEIVVSYLGLAPDGALLTNGYMWLPAEGPVQVSATDRVVIDYALVRLRAKIAYSTIAFHLMPASFSLGDLQQTYEAILSRPLDPRNFRRRMVSSGLLQSENRLRREGSHRPATLYRFSGNHDPGSFLTPSPTSSGDEHA